MELITKLATVLSLSVTEAPSPTNLTKFPRLDLLPVPAGLAEVAAAELAPVAGSTDGAVGELCGVPLHAASSSAATGRVKSAFFNCCPQDLRFERVRLAYFRGLTN